VAGAFESFVVPCAWRKPRGVRRKAKNRSATRFELEGISIPRPCGAFL
jgi:hypothetical protein